jgi:WD40 repeat protein
MGGYSGWARALAFSPDGAVLASGGDDRIPRLWEPPTGRLIDQFNNRSYAFLLTALTAAASRATAGQPTLSSAGTQGIQHSEPVQHITFSSDGLLLAAASRDKTVRVWDVTGGRVRHILRGHGDWVNAGAFSPGNKMLASGAGDGTVCLWDLATGKDVRVLRGHTTGVSTVAYSPNGLLLASGGNDGTLRLWDSDSGEQKAVLRPGGEREVAKTIRAVLFSPDGKTLAAGDEGGRVVLWDAEEGRQRNDWAAHPKPVHGLAFAPDGGTLATAGGDGTAKIWELPKAQMRAVLKVPGGELLHAVCFSPDGTELVTGGEDGVVRVWGTADGQERFALEGHRGWVRSVAFNPDGRTLASAGADGLARLWDPKTGSERPGLPATGDFLAKPLGEEVGAGRELRAQLLRNGLPVLRQSLRLPPGAELAPLSLAARLTGDLLTFQVNDLAPITFHRS